MATIKKGILSGFRGKLGNVVGKNGRNVSIITSYPSNLVKVKSELQIKVEKSMGKVRGLGGQVYGSILIHLVSIGNKKTTILSEFVKRNFVLFNAAETPLYSLIEFSRGKLLNTPIKNVALSVVNERVRITWSKNWEKFGVYENDKVFAVVIDAITGNAYASDYGTIRKDKLVDVSIPLVSNSQQLHVYLMFNQGNSSIVSNTNYYYSG